MTEKKVHVPEREDGEISGKSVRHVALPRQDVRMVTTNADEANMDAQATTILQNRTKK